MDPKANINDIKFQETPVTYSYWFQFIIPTAVSKTSDHLLSCNSSKKQRLYDMYDTELGEESVLIILDLQKKLLLYQIESNPY